MLHYGGLTHKDTHNVYGMLDMYYTYIGLTQNINIK